MRRHMMNMFTGPGHSSGDHNNRATAFKQFSKKIIRTKQDEPLLTLSTNSSLNNGSSSEGNSVEDNVLKTRGILSNKSQVHLVEEGSPCIPKYFENGFNATPHHTNSRNFENYDDCSVQCNDTEILENKCTENSNTEINDPRVRINEINIQMLSKSLHDHIFKNSNKQKEISKSEVRSIKNDLKSYDIKIEDATRLPDVNIKIPNLKGDDIEQHFFKIGEEQIKPYVKLIKRIMEDIPEMPSEWVLKEGWTRYTSDKVESVDYPLESDIIFDVEVCLREGPLPTLATAVTSKAWYGWVSKPLVDGLSGNFEGKQFTMNQLIPLESTITEYGEKLNASHKKPKILVGHNVSFDRSKIKEQYWLKQTGLRFIDTMSLHICVGGVNSYQRSILNSKKETDEMLNLLTQTSLNSLAEVHKFYCGSEIKKDSRDIFVNGTLADIRADFNKLMTYCANDVLATHNVFCQLYPIFEERFPHPVTLAGMLELGTAYLPINSNWQRYLNDSESTFEDLNYETKLILAKRAKAVCQLMHNERYKEDLWMWNEDWSTQTLKPKATFLKSMKNVKKKCETGELKEKEVEAQKYLADNEAEEDPLEREFAYLKETRNWLPSKLPLMPGYPAWYRKLCHKANDENWSPGPQNVSTSMKIVPKLLNLTWENYPLCHIKDKGWGILVPYTNDLNIKTNIPLKQLLDQCHSDQTEGSFDEIDYEMLNFEENVERNLHKTEFWRHKKKKQNHKQLELSKIYNGSAHWCETDIDNCCYFFKLPHKDGKDYNVGNPLAKDFLNKLSEHVLASSDASATELLRIAKMLSYWRNNRQRIMSQFVMWFENSHLPSSIKKTKKSIRYGAILPLVVVCGTLTRRAVERTWMTASNAHIERVGSELRAMIQAPPGYNIVGADVDSQELWISSIIGDAYYKKIHGATPFGWMTLNGTKASETDMHSVTAKAIGISRSQAKIINYARIYGAGQKFAERLLKQFNPNMTDSEAASKARKMFSLTKGKKVFHLKPEYVDDLPDIQYSSYDAYKIARLYGRTVQEMFQRNKWVGGSESAMFNSLEEIADSPQPVTPFLSSRLTRALEGQASSDKHLPTKVNWVVQSGAVDFLHLMLVSMKWLMKDNARFCLSFHDEVRYLVPSRYKYNTALAMHVTNLLTRSFCASRLGMQDLPMSVAFFSSVEVDTVLRKESENDCLTPSNPHGLSNGYEVLPGESLDVWATIEKCNGSLGSWHNNEEENN